MVQRNLTPMRQLLGELVDDAFDFGELGGFELLVTRFDGRGDAALDMALSTSALMRAMSACVAMSCVEMSTQ